MPYKSRRGRRRGRKRKAETKPKPEKKPVQTHTKRGRRGGRKQETDPIPPQVVDSSTSTTLTPVPSTSDDYDYTYSRILPYLTVAGSCENMFSRAYVKPTASLSECLFAEEDNSDEFEIEATEPGSIDIRCSENVSFDFFPLKTMKSFEETVENYAKPSELREEASGGEEAISQEQDNTEERSEKSQEGTSRRPSYTVLIKNDNPLRKPPREPRLLRSVSPCNFIPMTESEEVERMREIEARINAEEEVSVAEVRIYRRLKLRHMKREKNRRLYDPHVDYQSFWVMIRTSTRMSLDRYQHHKYTSSHYDCLNSFRTRTLGSKEGFSFLSPYTNRALKPFIMWDYETTPLWLRIMDELQRKSNAKNVTWEPSLRAPVDYCYIRPHHLPAMNSLAELYFWPDINLAECLRCPDFSCVVFYKKLLIGFTIAFPDFFRNDIYIAYMVVRKGWEDFGIGRVMIYHVIESSKGRDLTLHVSAWNPVILLYHKLGFKIVYFEKNFYSRYLPPDSTKCRQALYMRSKEFPKK